MKKIFVLSIMVAASISIQQASAAGECYYFAGGFGEKAVHRVSVEGSVLSVKLMGPDLSEIKGLACAYRVKDASDDSALGFQVEKKLSGPCESSLELLEGSVVFVSREKDKMASEMNGLSTFHAQISDQTSRPYWAHPCAEVDAL